jgi:hypothetical protein
MLEDQMRQMIQNQFAKINLDEESSSSRSTINKESFRQTEQINQEI